MKTKNDLKTTLLALFLIFAFTASTAFAQGGQQPAGQSVKGADIKGRAPVNKEVLKVRLPKAQEATLPNGLRILVLENSKVPTFSMQMVILSGGLSDPAEQHGLAQFTAALLREGTAKRTSREIAEQVDAIGATLGSSSSLAGFTSNVSTSGLIENLDQTLDLFADVIRNPKFAEDELAKYRTRTLASYQFLRSNPNFLAGEKFNRAIYGSHPAGLVVAPTESLQKTKSADLIAFHLTHYRPNNAILAIVGDVKLREIMPKIEKAFGDWQKADVPVATIPTVPEQGSAKIAIIDRPGSVQTVFQLGALGINRTDPDYFSVLLMDKVFGGGQAARLFLNLREDKGYTYGAYSGFSSSKYRGVLQASSEVRTEVTAGAMKEFMYELNRIRDEKVPDSELDNAKRSLIGSFALSLESPQTLIQNIITQKLYNLPADYWDTYPQRVSAITPDDVQRVAKKYYDLQRLQVVAVGDASKAKPILANYGTVEVFDADGKPKP